MSDNRMSGFLKRISSTVIATAIMASQFVGFAMEPQKAEVLFVENFNGIATNSTDISLDTDVDPNARVVEDGSGNKAFYMPGSSDNAMVKKLDAYDGNSIVVSAKIKCQNKIPPIQIILEDGTTKFIPVSTDEGAIVAHAGNKVGSVKVNEWSKIDVVYNKVTKRYSIYVNNKCLLEKYLFGAMSNIKTVSINIERTKDAAVYVDDVMVYLADEPVSGIKGADYNASTVDFTETAVEETAGRVYINNNFNDAVSVLNGLSPNKKGETIEYREEENGNGYLCFERANQSNDTYMDYTFGGKVSKNFVITADFQAGKKITGARLFALRDTDGRWDLLLTLRENGDLVTGKGTVIGKIKKQKWTKVAFVVDFKKKVNDVYVNGEKVVSNEALPNQSFDTLSIMRTQMMPDEGVGSLLIDNYAIYDGTEPRELEEDNDVVQDGGFSVLPNDDNSISELENKVALNIGSDMIFVNSEKKQMDAKPYITDGRTMIPVRAVAEAFNLETTWDESSRQVSLGNDISMKIGEKSIKVNDKEIAIDVAPEIKDDRTYLPLRALAEEALNKKVFYCDYGLIVISDREYTNSNDAELKQLSTYVFSRRPGEETIKNDFENSGYKNVHPRLHANAEDFARLREESKTNTHLKRWTNDVISSADILLTASPCEYVIPDGLRLLDTSREVQDRLLKLGYAYQITGDEKYAERAWKEMEKVCSYTDWNPRHFLDTAEMAYGVAVGYDWCYDYLRPSQRKIIEDAIEKYALLEGQKQYQGSPTGTNFVFQDMNWNVVCNGGLTAAALTVMETKPEIAAYTVKNAIRSFDYMITEFAPDGGWVEGPGYWGYTMKFFSIFMDGMKYSLGTDYNIPYYPGINKTAEHIFSLQGNTGCNNFNDVGGGNAVTSDVIWLGRYFGDDGLTSAYLAYLDTRNINGTVYDCLYYDTSVDSGTINMPLDTVTRLVESGSMRESWDNINGAWLSYRGGKAMVNHYHLCEGSFVFDHLGERWALDLGMDDITYGATFNGSLRNSIYRIRPEGHNCVVINPDDTPGQSTYANCPIIKSESQARGAYQVIDLTSAYDTQVKSYYRGYMLTDDRRTAVIRDEFSLLGSSTAYWFMHTAADVEIVSDDTAILTLNGKRMQFKFICEGATATLKVMNAEPLETSPKIDGQASNGGYRKLAIAMKGSGNVSVSVRLTPADEYTADKEFTCEPISDWSIPDGEKEEYPILSALYADGELISGFKPEESTFVLKSLSDTIPDITCDGGTYNVEYLSKAENYDGTTVIRVSDNIGRYRTYTVTYKKLPVLSPINGRTRLSPVDIYASSNPEEQNMDYQAADGDLSTRWSASGTPTLTCDFGKEQTIDGFAVAVMNGMSRQYQFRIRVSDDGMTFTDVYNGQTAGGTDDYEFFSIEPVKARYVQYLGMGNTTNIWNSVTEFAVFGQDD